jgi:hypothetical protein
MITDWNPILFLVQGSKPNIVGYLVNDMIESKPPDKSLNGWTQSTVEGPQCFIGKKDQLSQKLI